MVLWRLSAGAGRWMLKSGVSDRCWRCCCCCASGRVKGLVLLGRAGSGSAGKGPGEARRVSCERLRDGTGGGGSREEANGDGVESEEEEDDSSACRSDRAEDWREKDEGRVLEDGADTGTEGGARREEPRVRDWVVCQGDDDEEEDEEEEGEERKSDVRVSKGSSFHCASLWIPFSPFVCAAGAVSGLAASGGRACEERERGGGLGEARPCGGPAGAAAAAAAAGGACCGCSGAGSVGCIGGGSWD